MPAKEDKSFNEAMNDWAAKQSFFRNMGNRIVHPDPNHPLVVRVLGYLFRLCVVLFIAGGISYTMMKKHLASGSFSDKVGASLAEHLDAEEYTATRFLWKAKRVSMKRFTAKGNDDAFFRELDARFVRFRSAPLALLSSDWKLKDITIAELDVMLRSGAKTQVTARGDAARAELLYAGFGPPDFKSLSFESLTVDEAAFRWGLSDATRGAFRETAVSYHAPEEDDGKNWRLDFSGGVFQQNWLRDLRTAKVTVARKGDELVIEETEVTLASGGKGTLGGTVSLGAIPRVSLTLEITRAKLEDFLPTAFQRYASGSASGTILISGSINTKSGIETTGFLGVKGFLRNIPVFESLSLLTQTSRLRHFPITKGRIEFKTGGGSLNVGKIDIEAEDIAVLEGKFSLEPKDEEDPAVDLLSGKIPALPLKPRKTDEADADGPAIADLVCTGTVKLGVVGERLEALSDASANYFREERDGFRWMTIRLSGPVDQLTRSLYESMIADVTENRRNN